MPVLSYTPLFVGLRYLLKKKLSYLAALGVALSVGTLIVVMSVFTGFHLRLTSAIRGYLSDLTIRPATGQVYGMHDWQGWADAVRETEHVTGVAPFLQSFGLVRLPGTDVITHVLFRGIDPRLEGEVSDMPDYMRVGKLEGLRNTYTDRSRTEGGTVRAALVGREFPGFSSHFQLFDRDELDERPGRLILMTATTDLERRLSMFAVNGQFETGYYEYDSQFVVLDLQSAIDFVGSDGAVTGLNVRLDDFENAEEVRRLLMERMVPGAELRAFGAQEGEVRALATGAQTVAGLTAEGRVVLWDGGSGEPTEPPEFGGRATALALGPEGALLVIGRDDGSVVVLDFASAGEEMESDASGGPVTAVAVSPDGYLLAAGRGDGSAAIWDVGDPEPLAELGTHEGAVHSIAFDGLSERVVTASADGTACVWDAESGSRLGRLGLAGGPEILSAAFSSDGSQLATGDAAGRIILWDPEDGRMVGGWPAQTGGVAALAYSTAANALMTAGSGDVRVWQLRPGEIVSASLVGIIGRDDAPIRQTAFHANGRHLLTVGSSGRIRRLYCGPRFHVKTWQEEQSTFIEAVAMERFLMALILSLILVVALFFVFALVTTMVSERRRDIGILKGIGYTRRQIGLVFLIIGLAIGVGGSAVGIGGGLLFAQNINAISAVVEKLTGFNPFPPDVYYFKEIPHHVAPMSILLTASGAILGSLFFSIFPALRAARLDPVRTLHYE